MLLGDKPPKKLLTHESGFEIENNRGEHWFRKRERERLEIKGVFRKTI